MGSSSKKHKKDRDSSKKHKHRSRSRSPLSPDVRERERNERDRERERERERRHHKKHKENKDRRHHHKDVNDRSRDHAREPEEYHSDSSDVVEVPLAPPAPTIEKQSAGRSPSPIPENGAGDCLSIEETNKLRAKLGLKPLEMSNEPAKGEEKTNEDGDPMHKDEWGEFFHKPAVNITEKKQADKIREKLKLNKERRMREAKLRKLKGLGESDSEDDLNSWVDKNREKEQMKRDADKRAKMLQEMDEEFGVKELVGEELKAAKAKAYKDRDLKGLRIDHDVDQFHEGKTIILTLKDNEVLDEEIGDSLVNVNMVDDERHKKNVENRKKNPQLYGYNVYDEEVDEFGEPLGRNLLSKYDEDIEGYGKKKSFTIGDNTLDDRAQKRRMIEIKAKLAGKRLETLDDSLVAPARDTFTEEEMKFKKPKKKVKKLRQKLKAEDLLPLPSTQEGSSRDMGSRHRNQAELMTDDTPELDEDLSKVKVEEDDDLEQVLAKARRLKQKENFIARQHVLPAHVLDPKTEIKSEADSDDDMATVSRDGNIVLNATAEFCRTLGDIPTYGMAGNREEDAADMMDFENEALEPDEIKDEEPRSAWNSVNPDTEMITVDDKSNDATEVAILDEEPDVGSGVGAALRLAVSKGYLEKEEHNRPSNTRMAHLQAKHYSIEDKAYGDDEKFGRRDRFHSGPISDFREKDTYKPNVKLEYIDDNGRILNKKEAFRYLSHKFHGKGPGKNKIEKRIKKMEQEGLMKKMSSTDTPLGTLTMLQQKQKETQSPYIVLSGSKQTHASTSIVKH